MFYEPDKKNHCLPRDPFKSLVVPRPIGWISTLDEDGRPNLAPYSFFNAVASDPPCVMFAAGLRPEAVAFKDSQANAEKTGEFVVNMATYDLREQMNISSAGLPAGQNEFEAAGLETLPSSMVKPPRVKGAPVHLECKYLQTVKMPSWDPERGNYVIFGRVVGIHIADEVINDKGFVDVTRFRPISRLGYMEYAVVNDVFVMNRPGGAG